MLHYYLKLAIRNLTRNRIANTVKILGMALAIIVSMIIFSFVYHESHYDRFFSNHLKVYRTIAHYTGVNGEESSSFGVSPPIAGELKNTYPEVIEVCRVSRQSGEGLIKHEESFYETERILSVDSTFFKIFNINMILGNPLNCLNEPDVAVLSESFSHKLFGKDNPLGNTIYLENYKIRITGVYKDFPSMSHFDPEIIISYTSKRNLMLRREGKWAADGPRTYVMFRAESDLKRIGESLGETHKIQFEKRITGLLANCIYSFQPVTDIHTQDENFVIEEFKPTISKRTLSILLFIGIIILIIAWFNNINISLNLKFKQIKQNSIDTISGMKKHQQLYKVLVDVSLIMLSSLFIAVVALILLQPSINQLLSVDIDLTHFPQLWGWILLALFTFVLFSVFLETALLSGTKLTEALKGQLGNSAKGKYIKRSIIIGQNAIAVLLIFFTCIVYFQTRHLINYDIGMQTDGIIVIRGKTLNLMDPNTRQNRFAFLNEVKKIPEVQCASFSIGVPGSMSFHRGINLDGMSPDSYTGVGSIRTDENFLKTYNISLLCGRNITEVEKESKLEVLVSRRITKTFNLKKPEDALGRFVIFGPREDGEKRKIVGVIEDIYESSYDTYGRNGIIIRPAVARLHLSVRYNTSQPQALIGKIEEKWNAFFGEPHLHYFFLDDAYRKVYSQQITQRKILSLFTLAAILIACFGLFAVSFENTIQRTKEIGIRKVHGARISNILSLLFKNYLVNLSIAILPGLLVAYIIANRWLEEFTHKINISIIYFIVPIIILIIITLLTVLYHTLKVAISNPIDALKYE